MRGHVLVWAAGDDEKSVPFAKADLDELRRGAPRSGVDVSWVVDLGYGSAGEWKAGEETPCERLPDVNMGDPDLLDEWIASRPGLAGGEGMLVFSGHGTGWAGQASTPRRRILGDRERLGGPHGMVAVDATHADALDTEELAAVLGRRFHTSPLALLVFDACFMAGLELFAHLAPYARVLVGSAYEAPSSGLSYDHLLVAYAGAGGEAELASALVAEFGSRWTEPPESKVAQLVAVSGTGVIAARDALHALGAAAVSEGVRPPDEAFAALRPFDSPTRSYDAIELAELLRRTAGGRGQTAAAAERLVQAVRGCVVAAVSHPSVHASGIPVYVGDLDEPLMSRQYLQLVGPQSGWARFLSFLRAP